MNIDFSHEGTINTITFFCILYVNRIQQLELFSYYTLFIWMGMLDPSLDCFLLENTEYNNTNISYYELPHVTLDNQLQLL